VDFLELAPTYVFTVKPKRNMFLVGFSDYLHHIYLMSLKLRILLILKSLLLHLEIGGRLKTKLYESQFPIISSNIPASPVYGVDIFNSYVILELVPSIGILWNELSC